MPTKHRITPPGRWTLLVISIAAFVVPIIWLIVYKDIEALLGILAGVAGLVVYFRSTSLYLDVVVSVLVAILVVVGLVYVLSPLVGGPGSPTYTPTPTATPTQTESATASPTPPPSLAQEQRSIEEGRSGYFFDEQLVISLQNVSFDGMVSATIGSVNHPNIDVADEILGYVTYYQSDYTYEIRITEVSYAPAMVTFSVTRLPATDQALPHTSPAPADTPQSQPEEIPTRAPTARSPMPTSCPILTCTPNQPATQVPAATSTRPTPIPTPRSPTPTSVPPTDTPSATPSPTATPLTFPDWDTQIERAYIENRVHNLTSVEVQVTGFIKAKAYDGVEQTVAEVPASQQSCPPGSWCGPIGEICKYDTDFDGEVWGTTWVYYEGVEQASKSFGRTRLTCSP